MTEASIRTYQELQECGELDGARNTVYMEFLNGDHEGTAGGISGVLETKNIIMVKIVKHYGRRTGKEIIKR